MIEYRNVQKAYGAPVLEGIDLVVKTGEILSIVGPSGVGKSVLLKTTNGLVAPDEGDVVIDGESVVDADRAALEIVRSRVGYVFQYAALFDSWNVFENVALGLSDETILGLGPSGVVSEVSRALREVNLDPAAVLTRLPAQLSGGMKKRVGLARAIVGHPSILLYDEPVTGLDPVNASIVSRLIQRISDERQATSVVVTHDVERALDMSDRIALLVRGRIRFVGDAADFRRSDDRIVRAFADRAVADRAADELLEEL